MSNLYPAHIIDKNGVPTTRNKRVGASAPSARVAGMKVVPGSTSENAERLESFYEYSVAFASEFDNRVRDIAGAAATEAGIAIIEQMLDDDENRHARTVQHIAGEVEDAFHAASADFSNPDDLVSEMYTVMNTAFDQNKHSPSDDEDEVYRKRVNREFILDATLVLSGQEAVLYPVASEL